MSKYGFEIQHYEAKPEGPGWGGVIRAASPESWIVQLPHQCDGWEITRGGATHEQAIEDLEAFIAEAQRTLAELKTRP